MISQPLRYPQDHCKSQDRNPIQQLEIVKGKHREKDGEVKVKLRISTYINN